MPRYYLECDDRLARRIEGIATRYGLTEEEVVGQLVEVGLDELDSAPTR
ncbi:MAG: CopG family transcriptional regulator [Halobacteriota archaeon]